MDLGWRQGLNKGLSGQSFVLLTMKPSWKAQEGCILPQRRKHLPVATPGPHLKYTLLYATLLSLVGPRGVSCKLSSGTQTGNQAKKAFTPHAGSCVEALMSHGGSLRRPPGPETAPFLVMLLCF